MNRCRIFTLQGMLGAFVMAAAAGLITAPAPGETVHPVQRTFHAALTTLGDQAVEGLLVNHETRMIVLEWLDQPSEPEFNLDVRRFSASGASSAVSFDSFAIGQSLLVIHTPVETDLTWDSAQDARQENWSSASTVDVPLVEPSFIVASR